MKKLNIIYDISSLYDGAYMTSARSGIYFCSINILKELIKIKKLNLVLYCSAEKIPEVFEVLNREFSNTKYQLISDKPNNYFTNFFQYLNYVRRKVKANEKNQLKRFILKTILKFIIFPLKPANNIVEYYLNKYEKPQDFNNYAVLSPCYPIIDTKLANCKKYTILHDTIPLIMPEKNPMALKNTWYSKLLSILNSNDYYFVNSESTRRDFLKYYPQIDPDKIITVLHACGAQFKPQSANKIIKTKEKYNIPTDKKYIFSLCTLEPRKNLIRTVKTFIQFIKKNNIDDLVFVLGGGHWEIFIAQLEQEIENLGEFKNKIIRTGYIADEDLPHLYSGAEWFVYTSQYEGFGVPPLEAMSCGCPVIVSNNSSLPEVVGNAGLLIDWDSDEQHIEAYEKYYFNENIRKEYAQKGLERAKEFSWQKSAEQMIEYINKTFSEETILNDEQKTNIC